jgi:TetR/AcrR family transcriptional repressor of nem operon
MRYPATETAEKHRRILEAASKLFRERGFSGVSLGEIMKATGLTHGPFYNHFASKEALMSEAVAFASQQSNAGTELTPEWRETFVRGYLSAAHRDAPGEGCLIAALAGEIGRAPAMKRSFTEHLSGLVERMAGSFAGTSRKKARARTIRTLASLVGAVVLARAVDDEAFSAEILREVEAGLSGQVEPGT